MSKITKFPIGGFTRRKNKLGKFAVTCQVSDRWLDFAPTSAELQSGEFITIDVRTGGYSGKDKERKLAQLIVTREDLMNVLERVKPE